MSETAPVLSIVIPALDEEDAIGSTVQRCLDAREHVRAQGGVADVEILVVSDGSTDRTEEIARGFEEVTVLGFTRNRGYGAAIQCGFAVARGDLLGFLDADGTCEPRVFADLCRAILEGPADVALGSRMGPGSEMPRVRAIGNTLFAWLLGLLSRQLVRDTASGMRVLRRSALPDLYPLPDGLHFTPAMSARVLLERRLRLVEVPMPYAERVGQSKLRVMRDGVRFLGSIVKAAVCYRPARLLLPVAAALALCALGAGALPLGTWLREGRFDEWMIYRVLLAALLGTIVWVLVCTAVVADRIVMLALGRAESGSAALRTLGALFGARGRRVLVSTAVLGAVALVWPGGVEWLETGHVTMHWSRAVLASLLLVAGALLGVSTFLLNMMTLIEAQRRPRAGAAPADRVRPGRGAPA